MAERRPPLAKIAHIEFCKGVFFEINAANPPKAVALPPHYMLGPEGEETDILCEGRTGSVSVSRLMDLDYTYKVMITCCSAALLNPMKNEARQCTRSASVNV